WRSWEGQLFWPTLSRRSLCRWTFSPTSFWTKPSSSTCRQSACPSTSRLRRRCPSCSRTRGWRLCVRWDRSSADDSWKLSRSGARASRRPAACCEGAMVVVIQCLAHFIRGHPESCQAGGAAYRSHRRIADRTDLRLFPVFAAGFPPGGSFVLQNCRLTGDSHADRLIFQQDHGWLQSEQVGCLCE